MSYHSLQQFHSTYYGSLTPKQFSQLPPDEIESICKDDIQAILLSEKKHKLKDIQRAGSFSSIIALSSTLACVIDMQEQLKHEENQETIILAQKLINFSQVLLLVEFLMMLHMFYLTRTELQENTLVLNYSRFVQMKLNMIISDGVIESVLLLIQSYLVYKLDLDTIGGFLLSSFSTLLDYVISIMEYKQAVNMRRFLVKEIIKEKVKSDKQKITKQLSDVLKTSTLKRMHTIQQRDRIITLVSEYLMMKTIKLKNEIEKENQYEFLRQKHCLDNQQRLIKLASIYEVDLETIESQEHQQVELLNHNINGAIDKLDESVFSKQDITNLRQNYCQFILTFGKYDVSKIHYLCSSRPGFFQIPSDYLGNRIIQPRIQKQYKMITFSFTGVNGQIIIRFQKYKKSTYQIYECFQDEKGGYCRYYIDGVAAHGYVAKDNQLQANRIKFEQQFAHGTNLEQVLGPKGDLVATAADMMEIETTRSKESSDAFGQN